MSAAGSQNTGWRGLEETTEVTQSNPLLGQSSPGVSLRAASDGAGYPQRGGLHALSGLCSSARSLAQQTRSSGVQVELPGQTSVCAHSLLSCCWVPLSRAQPQPLTPSLQLLTCTNKIPSEDVDTLFMIPRYGKCLLRRCCRVPRCVQVTVAHQASPTQPLPAGSGQQQVFPMLCHISSTNPALPDPSGRAVP